MHIFSMAVFIDGLSYSGSGGGPEKSLREK